MKYRISYPSILPRVFDSKMPKIIHVPEQIHIGTMISVFICPPAEPLMASNVVGTRLKQLHPIIERVIISGEALFPQEALLSCSIAFIPRGVAEFDIPSRFADMHAVISSVAMFCLNASGNMILSKGFNNRDIPFINPTFLKTLSIPFHSIIIPIIEKQIFTPFSAPVMTACESFSTLPVTIAVGIEITERNEKIFPIIKSAFCLLFLLIPKM